jgi:hypothetical protein
MLTREGSFEASSEPMKTVGTGAGATGSSAEALVEPWPIDREEAASYPKAERIEGAVDLREVTELERTRRPFGESDART